jgi:hypothetical protein
MLLNYTIRNHTVVKCTPAQHIKPLTVAINLKILDQNILRLLQT